MAKRRQSSGLPKPRKKTPETEGESASGGEEPLRQYKSRAEREAEVQRQVIRWTAGTLALIVIIVAGAFIYDQIIRPSQGVASVNGSEISVGEYQERVRLERALHNVEISRKLSRFQELTGTADINQVFQQLYRADGSFRTAYDELQSADQLGLRVLNDMIDDRLVRAEAEERNVSATDEEIDREIELFLNINQEGSSAPSAESPAGEPDSGAEATAESTPEAEPSATPTPTPLVSPTPTSPPAPTATPQISPTPSTTPFPTSTPTATPNPEERAEQIDEQVADFYRYVGNAADLTRGDIRGYFEAQVLRDKLAESVLDIGETAIWVNARQIQVDTEDAAQDIIDALNTGEPFMALANANTSPSPQQQRFQQPQTPDGGELGWVNSNQLDNRFSEAFAEAARNQDIGAISTEPIESDQGFHVLQVRAREERDMSEAEREQVLADRFEGWLEEFRESDDNSYETYDNWPDVVPTTPAFDPTALT